MLYKSLFVLCPVRIYFYKVYKMKIVILVQNLLYFKIIYIAKNQYIYTNSDLLN